ncbi:iron(III) transport system permease protein [Shimia gijangensis]|uniref:Iron(III) transport system permease protein n=2 Tax=Shimia gijangensis TaxID=1470563 RepID=A0A1M6LUL4_9RHOB|nr:iron(III) transport system permease protein [Shimia gijangensis]
MTAANAVPDRRAVVDRTRSLSRLWISVILVYLAVTLVLPLSVMLSKSISTYQFDLEQFSFMASNEDGQFSTSEARASDLNDRLSAPLLEELATSANGRLSAAQFFPDFSFRSPVLYRVRGNDPDARFLVGSTPHQGTAWVELTSNEFRRVQLRPVRTFGISNFTTYFQTPALVRSIGNSLLIASITMVITVSLAFGLAYALTRSCLRFQGAFRLIAMAPILVPSLLPGIALIYLFGNQGILKELMMGASIYGPIGIVIGSVFFTFPHAFVILSTTLAVSDARLYEAAESLKAPPWRVFLTVTLPGARYGLISAAFVTFNLVIADFGLPKVIGGQFNVLAVDIYKQVIGQQNFEMGAVVSVVLLLPAVLAFAVDAHVRRRQVAQVSARTVPLVPKPSKTKDRLWMIYCLTLSLFIVGLLATCQFAALVKFWPYDLSLGFMHFRFDLVDGGGWPSYFNSLKLGVMTAIVGCMVIFLGAYLVEKTKDMRLARGTLQIAAMLPMAVPGLVLGLAYIFFFNAPGNPLNSIYGTMTILVICTVTHFYTVPHLTALTALKQIDPEFEAVSDSLGQPRRRVLFGVTIPLCLPAILDISIYLFVNAITTVSAVVFLYAPKTSLASVAILNMDDAGDIAPAAAMGMLIFYTNVVARLVHLGLSRGLLRRTQAWRHI